MLRTEKLGRQGVDATHFRGMVHASRFSLLQQKYETDTCRHLIGPQWNNSLRDTNTETKKVSLSGRKYGGNPQYLESITDYRNIIMILPRCFAPNAVEYWHPSRGLWVAPNMTYEGELKGSAQPGHMSGQ